MSEDISKEKLKTQDILSEIENLKKCTNQIANNVRSNKIESLVDNINNNVNKLQNETEVFYNRKFGK